MLLEISNCIYQHQPSERSLKVNLGLNAHSRRFLVDVVIISFPAPEVIA
ncbi:hypothetical protein GTQ43_38915 [Nostoc sp. KVJ3]|nr:hypothetical protein [Nostoc sp. KVJ3]MCW5319293.1 hypothetical protein [Nostoc sp. KVJ3]MCW5319331.1 hypothetical protein [Nostoc sp. KVJ3]